jgi:hypothetical protein
VRAAAEARILDVATGDLLAADAANTRFAVARGASRQEAARAALDAASRRLARYLRFHLENLSSGEPHAARLVAVSFNGVREEQAAALRDAMGRLESVQRVLFRKFTKRLLRVDVLLRASEADFELQMSALRPEGFSLRRDGQAAAGGLEFTVIADEKPASK